MADYDPQVLNAIFARANEVSDPSKRNRYLRAALQTGIVESGLRNLDYGDADSQGWRQERASLYPNPTNIAASVNRFFEEAAQHDRGQPSWQLAADVQRPAAQYRGRYKDVASQAAALLNGHGAASTPRSSGSPDSAAGGLSAAPAAPASIDGGQAGDFTSLLATLAAPRQQAPSSSLPGPPNALALPEGFRPLAPAQREEAPAQDAVSASLGLLEALKGSGPTVGSSEGSGGSDSPKQESVLDRVTAQRKQGYRGEGFTGGYPLGVEGKVIGTPNAGTHTLGNWQSDNAVDISVPEGTPMVALQDGVIVKVRRHPQDGGRFAGDQITVRGANGNMYFYAHGIADVKPGQKVKRGDQLGVTGSANGVPHLHFGQWRGDPRQHVH